MIKYNWDYFINNIAKDLLIKKIDARIDICDKEYLDGELFKAEPYPEFTHFFAIPGMFNQKDPIFLAAECFYHETPFRFEGQPFVHRIINKIWVFKDEFESEFYKVVLERGNPNNMEPCLFN
jgi:hypothetical protein